MKIQIRKKTCCAIKTSLTYLTKAYAARKIAELYDATMYILSPRWSDSVPGLSSLYDAR
jgi:hypothetical protein